MDENTNTVTQPTSHSMMEKVRNHHRRRPILMVFIAAFLLVAISAGSVYAYIALTVDRAVFNSNINSANTARQHILRVDGEGELIATLSDNKNNDVDKVRFNLTMTNSSGEVLQRAVGSIKGQTVKMKQNVTPGDYTFTVKSEDTLSENGTQYILKIDYPNDVTGFVDKIAPTVGIQQPELGGEVSGVISVMGTAGDDIELSQVSVRVGESGTWVIADGTSSWNTQIDTTKFQNGQYIIEAQAIDSSGNTFVAKTLVFFANENPIVPEEPNPVPTPDSNPSPNPNPDTGVTTPTDGQFLATFDTASDFYNRFVYHTGNYRTSDGKRPEDVYEPGAYLDWLGDHDLNCGPPTTYRNINVENHNEFFYHCAPGGDSTKGHIMTSINTNAYVIAGFSPNQTFNNITEVCWDINKTDLGGGKWTNVIVVPENTYLSNPNTDQKGIAQGEGPYRLDYVTPGFNEDNGPGDFNLQRFDIWGSRTFRTQLTMFRGDDVFWESYNGEFNNDKMARYKNCIKNNSDGTVTLMIKNPSGSTSAYTSNTQMPSGKVRVIFQDDNYNPPKREGYSSTGNTWHWDNIYIK